MTALLKMSIKALCCIPGFGDMAYDRFGLFIWNLICITMKKYWGKKSVEWFERLFLKVFRYFEPLYAYLIRQKEVGDDKPILNLLFVGSSNGGKKSIIKSIMNKDCIDDLLEAPGVKHARNKDAFGRDVYAVKCPGFQHTQPGNYKTIPDIDNLKNAHEIIKHFDAIVFCIPYAKGLRKEEIDYIEMMKEVLGSSEFRNKFILAMTRAEDCDRIKNELCLENIFDLLMKFGRVEIKNLLQECNNRCVLFNNKTKNKKVMKEQAVDFFKMVENIKAFHTKKEDENGNTVRSPLSDAVFNQNDNTESESQIFEAAFNQSYSESSAEPLIAAITPAECGDDVQSNMQESNELIKRSDIGLQEGPGIASSGSQSCTEDSSTDQYGTTLLSPSCKSPDLATNSCGDLKYRMIQSYMYALKEKIRAEDFTDVMHQEGILSLEEKMYIDEMHVVIKIKYAPLELNRRQRKKGLVDVPFELIRRQRHKGPVDALFELNRRQRNKGPVDALFEAIYRHRNEGSVDVFLKILKEKYFPLYETWKYLYGSSYDSITAHGSYDTAKRYGLGESSSVDDDFQLMTW